MDFEAMIPADDFCVHHRIEVSFLHSLQDYGLIELVTAKEACYVRPDQLNEIERFIRLHRDLHINLEGLDAVKHLLQRLEALQSETANLRNRLRFYESASWLG